MMNFSPVFRDQFLDEDVSWLWHPLPSAVEKGVTSDEMVEEEEEEEEEVEVEEMGGVKEEEEEEDIQLKVGGGGSSLDFEGFRERFQNLWSKRRNAVII